MRRAGSLITPLVLVVLALLPACSSYLNVYTEVYDGETPDISAAIRLATRTMREALQTFERDAVSASRKAVTATATRLKERLPATKLKAPGTVGSQIATQLEETVFGEQFKQEIEALSKQLNQAELNNDLRLADDARKEFNAFLTRASNNLDRELNSMRREKTNERIKAAEKATSNKLSDDQIEEIEGGYRSLFDQFGVSLRAKLTAPARTNTSEGRRKLQKATDWIFGDAAARQIVGDDENWKQYMNDARVLTCFGNAEIAFQMENYHGEVHIKGVKFDPKKALQATFTVLEQAATMAASTYGIPLTPSSAAKEDNQDGGTPDPAITPSKAGIARELAQIRSSEDRRTVYKGATFLALLDLCRTLELLEKKSAKPLPEDCADIAAKLEEFAEKITMTP
jgi:hypothetical protein